MENITQPLHLSGKPDTYFNGDSYRSEIRIFSPAASFSNVSMRGIDPLQMSDIVDFGTPVSMDTCRTVRFFSYIIFCSRIFIMQYYSILHLVINWYILERSYMERLFKGNSILGFLDDYVIIDTETTGHSPKYDSIIEIAAIRYSSGSEIGRYQSFINPMFLIDDFITKLTGITNDMLRDAPDAKDVIKHFIDFVGDSVIIGHNVNFDINFIYDLCESFSLRHFSNDYIDTMRLSRNLCPEDAHHRLSDLCGKFGFDYSNAHRSLIDCELTQKCYCRMNDYYESIGCSFPLQDARKEHDCLSSKSSYHLKASDITSSVECFDDDNPMFGKLFVFTGTLEKMPRKDAMQIVVDHGGSVGDSVTKKTNYLVLGDNSYCKSIRDGKSSKIKKAEKLKLDGIDIEIIPESVFYDMIL